MPKNCYIALGISKGADLRQIKKAYRKIIKDLHPDKSRSQSTQDRFMEIQEAYETLADPEKRKVHDAVLERETPRRGPSHGSPLHHPPVFENKAPPISSLVDEFFDGFLPGFLGSGRPGAIDKDIYLEVVLTPDEAQNGGVFPVTVPVVQQCPRCRGRPSIFPFGCHACRGEAVMRRQKSFSLCIPPRTRDGEYLRLSMEDIGLPGVTLHIDVRVEPENALF